MAEVQYSAPANLADAVALLAGGGSPAVLAGGTDLLVQLRGGRSVPSAFIDIKRIPELTAIRMAGDVVSIGAAVPAAQITEHPELSAVFPGVVEALGLIGSTQIQGRATPGGNLCNASPAADSVPAMAASGAICRVAGPAGEQRIPVEQFVTGPGKTVLRAGEFLVCLELPRPAEGTADAYLRFIPRTEMDIAVAGAAAGCGFQAVAVHDRAVAFGRVPGFAVGRRQAHRALRFQQSRHARRRLVARQRNARHPGQGEQQCKRGGGERVHGGFPAPETCVAWHGGSAALNRP
jgi:carbon-monoxide dehydrogenase medium subunit